MSARNDNSNNKKVRDHSWKGTWNRPMKVDEGSFDPLTVARMTDHNVRGVDEGSPSDQAPSRVKASGEKNGERHEDEGGKVSPEEAIRIQSKDLP